MVSRRVIAAAWVCAGSVLACDVQGPRVGSGGVDFGDAGSTGAADGGMGRCPSAVYVVNTDFLSTTVSILDPDGSVLSETFVSSASGSVGLSEPLSGDVYVPTQAVSREKVVLLDNAASSVVSWVDVESARVESQLRVGQGFFARPHDYVEVPPDRAYVARFGPNPTPGRQPLDSGSDLAVIDLEAGKLTGTVSLADALDGADAGYHARPEKIVRVERYVYALLNMSTLAFDEYADGRLAVIDTQTDSVVGVVELTGLAACSGLDASPSGASLAITCSGDFDGEYFGFERSGVVVMDVDGARVAERARWHARALESGPLGFFASFANETLLAISTFPYAKQGEVSYVDALVTLDIESGQSEVVLEAEEPFTLPQVRCLPGCESCLLADKGNGGSGLHRFRVTEEGLEPNGRIRVDRATGLPPWAIAVLR